MYHRIVKKRITSVFERLGKGDYQYALADVGATIEHRFAGEHSLGGTRTSVGAMRHWLDACTDCFRICGSSCIPSRCPVAPGIPRSWWSGRTAPLPPTGPTM
jgi:hypothetical protein